MTSIRPGGDDDPTMMTTEVHPIGDARLRGRTARGAVTEGER
jgi:hypothetical protein